MTEIAEPPVKDFLEDLPVYDPGEIRHIFILDVEGGIKAGSVSLCGRVTKKTDLARHERSGEGRKCQDCVKAAKSFGYTVIK